MLICECIKMKNELELNKVLADIKDPKIMMDFLKDITTPKEFETLQQRLNVVCLLHKELSYNEISKITKASTTTITRVARFFKDEKYGGYRWVIKNILKK